MKVAKVIRIHLLDNFIRKYPTIIVVKTYLTLGMTLSIYVSDSGTKTYFNTYLVIRAKYNQIQKLLNLFESVENKATEILCYFFVEKLARLATKRISLL